MKSRPNGKPDAENKGYGEKEGKKGKWRIEGTMMRICELIISITNPSLFYQALKPCQVQPVDNFLIK